MVDTTLVTRLVEVLALAVAAAYVYRLRRGGWQEYLVLVAAGFLAEESSMFLYGYYGYGDRWAIVVHRTPLAVMLIWPVVVLSSLCLTRRAHDLSRVGAALWTGALVVYDTLVLEPVGTRVGLWWWKDGGYFGVPFLGVLGWGFFGVAAALVLFRGGPIGGWSVTLRPLLIAAFTQAMLAPFALPSIAYDVTIRLTTEAYASIIAALAVLLLPFAFWLRRVADVGPHDIAFKVAGAAIFFGLIYGLWLEPFVGFCSLVPLPYLVLTLLRQWPSELPNQRVQVDCQAGHRPNAESITSMPLRVGRSKTTF